jgi:ribosomal-protein-alanine N-acetyltransferase
MRSDDLDSVMSIDTLSFSLPWPESSYRYELNDNSAADLWVAERSSSNGGLQIIGMIVIWLILGEAHIATLAVHPDFRGRGIGSQLLEVGLMGARNNGAREAMLEVRASNHVAQALYEGYGFEVVYRRSRYYRDNNEDALLMNLDNLDDLILKKEEV